MYDVSITSEVTWFLCDASAESHIFLVVTLSRTGYFRRVTSWRVWAVLARASLAVLLLHWLVNVRLVAARRTLSEISIFTIVSIAAGLYIILHICANLGIIRINNLHTYWIMHTECILNSADWDVSITKGHLSALTLVLVKFYLVAG